jgi:transcriptional regulator with PAS, ATPase and Fis domain
LRLRTRPGHERLAVLSATQLTGDDGRVQGVMVVITDISEEVSANQQEIVAESQAMRNVMNFVRRVAMSEASTILIEGENGTGKDLVAKTLHYQSRRREGPFIAINCAAIPETLLESEMFGYEKGAFTDAKSQKKGLFELADGGTLFLDEIGEIPLVLQAKLLRVLEEQTMRRLGGLKDVNVDVRVVAATNKDLREAVKEKAFRQDLYFRLNVIQVTIPALRERPDDIIPLAEFFIEHFNRKFKRRIEGLCADARDLLLSHAWPGNVRELRNAMERAMILEETNRLTACSLPIVVHRDSPIPEPSDPLAMPVSSSAAGSWYETERRLLISALGKSGGNQSVAARLLGITRDKLRYQMKKFDIKPHNN